MVLLGIELYPVLVCLGASPHPCVFSCYADNVQPACLPKYDQNFRDGTQCWTSGFGTTNEGSRMEPHTL